MPAHAEAGSVTKAAHSSPLNENRPIANRALDDGPFRVDGARFAYATDRYFNLETRKVVPKDQLRQHQEGAKMQNGPSYPGEEC